MKSWILLTILLVCSSTLLAQNYYTENFITEPGFDTNDDIHYWDSEAGNFKFTVTIGILETYANSPQFSSVDIQENFTILFDFYAELYDAGEYLTPSISFSSTPNIIDKVLELQLSAFNGELFLLKVKDQFDNVYSSDLKFYEKTWYRVKLVYLSTESSLSILIWPKGNPDYLIWEKEAEIKLSEDFSYLDLGKDCNQLEMGGCVVSIDSVNIYGEYNTSVYSNIPSEGTFRIYPNPSKSIFNISTYKDLTKKYKIEVYNPLGKVVLQRNINSVNTSINTKKLPEGLYFIKLTDAEGNSIGTKRLVIRR